jgi:hypothetical protein
MFTTNTRHHCIKPQFYKTAHNQPTKGSYHTSSEARRNRTARWGPALRHASRHSTGMPNMRCRAGRKSAAAEATIRWRPHLSSRGWKAMAMVTTMCCRKQTGARMLGTLRMDTGDLSANITRAMVEGSLFPANNLRTKWNFAASKWARRLEFADKRLK